MTKFDGNQTISSSTLIILYSLFILCIVYSFFLPYNFKFEPFKSLDSYQIKQSFRFFLLEQSIFVKKYFIHRNATDNIQKYRYKFDKEKESRERENDIKRDKIKKKKKEQLTFYYCKINLSLLFWFMYFYNFFYNCFIV